MEAEEKIDMKYPLFIFVIGTIITYAVAWRLARKGDELDAAAVIVLSPFPCPPGLPC